MSLELGPYELRLLTVAACYALPVLGYQLVFGHAGALSLAQGAFFGLGAYATALLATRLGWGFLATFPASILLPTALAAVVAAPVLRLRSHYFALATLGIAQVVTLAAVEWTWLTGGANGLAGIPGIVMAGVAVPRGGPMLALAGGIALAGALASALALRGRWRRAFALAREHPLAAAAIGLDEGRMRFAAFVASAAYAGAGGALYVHTLRVVSPESLGFPVMVACLAMTVIGGSTEVAGAFIGAFLLVHLPEWFRFLDLYRNVAYGAALLVAIVAAPYGIAGAAARLLPRRTVRLPAPRAPTPRSQRGSAGPLLAIEDLAKSFGGVAALAGVTLALARGEILGLIGPNGSGKTTLVNLVSGFERPDRGAVRLDGADVAGLAPHRIARLGVARSFQSLALGDGMSALDAVALARRKPLAQARAEAMHFLGRVGIGEEASEPIGRLPYGLRRRVELARALALDPRLLLLDEPAAGLTPAEQLDLARRLRALADEGLGLLVVEHDMPFLLGLADRVACLDEGRLIAAGAPAEIRRDKAVIAAYLGEAA
jgi:branched-chain amino acid transport system permease protein